jgi:hypothetical protein
MHTTGMLKLKVPEEYGASSVWVAELYSVDIEVEICHLLR